jgi:hypothetical protein
MQIPYQYKFDRTTTSNVVYMGISASGSLTSEAKWQIVKIENNSSGEALSITNADGTFEPTKIWDNRTTYTYK